MGHWVSPRELLIPFTKFNPNHDPHDGKFTSANGAAGGASDVGSGNDHVTQLAQYRTVAQGESLAAEAKRADSMPQGKRYTGSGPMSDAEWDDHSDYVQRTLVANGGDDTLHSPLSTHISEDMVKGVEGDYNDHRRVMQNQILNDYDEQGRTVPNERRCIMTGGPMGAGKSTILRLDAKNPHSVAGQLGITYDRYDEKGNGVGAPSNFIVLSADDISEKMANSKMIPEVDHLDPMETATFVHEEASRLSKRLADRMELQGKNVIWDFSMASPGAVLSRMHDLNAEGYHTAGVFVDVSMAQSAINAERRARHGHDDWIMGKGPGGRTPPMSHVMASTMSGGPYRSKNAKVFSQMQHAGVFDQTVLVDNENYANKVLEITGKNANEREPEPVRTKDAAGRELKVGDQVEHRDGSEGIIGTVEHLPERGGDDNRIGVYWITPGKGAVRDKHPSEHLIKVGGSIVAKPRPQLRFGERMGLPGTAGGDAGRAPSPELRPVGA